MGRTITFENETSVEITKSGRAKIHTDYDRLKALPKVMPEIGRIPWTLTHCWDSENGALPKGFPSTPWTIHFPGMDVLYISMLDQKLPPATKWYTLNLENRHLTLEGTTSVEIAGPGRVKIHTDPARVKKLRMEKFQRLRQFKMRNSRPEKVRRSPKNKVGALRADAKDTCTRQTTVTSEGSLSRCKTTYTGWI